MNKDTHNVVAVNKQSEGNRNTLRCIGNSLLVDEKGRLLSYRD